MKRGPKPVDVMELREKAYSLALALYAVRHGWPGLLTHLKGGLWVSRVLPELREHEVGHPERATQRTLAGQMQYSPFRYKVTTLALPLPLTRKWRKDVLGLVRRDKNWRFTPPTSARSEIWKRLTIARSVAEVRKIARRLRPLYPLLASTLDSHAEDFLRAKQLPNYPRSNRPRSADKRTQFFAKTLAGLSLRIAPATAIKRLAHSALPDTQAFHGLFNVSYITLSKVLQRGETK